MPIRRCAETPAAEELFVGVERPHADPAKPANGLHAIDELAHVRRAERDGLEIGFGREPGPSEQPAGDDFDLDAKLCQRAHPRQMLGLAAAPHHREASHQVGHAHERALLRRAP